MASLAPSTHPGPVCAVLVLIFCGVLVAPSRGAGIQARHDRSKFEGCESQRMYGPVDGLERSVHL